MIKIENVEVVGWESAIRGMRNPMNSWDKSDSRYCDSAIMECDRDECIQPDNCIYCIGENDLALMKKLAKAGTDHRKFMRMIVMYADITAPLYWWAEYDTYKVGTVRNSCSKMHTIHIKPFVLDDFSHEGCDEITLAKDAMRYVISVCEGLRESFNTTQEKKYWRAIIELLPESFNQRATLMLNYEVLANMYHSRKTHKLDEWREFCKWIETLPYSELITGERPANE